MGEKGGGEVVIAPTKIGLRIVWKVLRVMAIVLGIVHERKRYVSDSGTAGVMVMTVP